MSGDPLAKRDLIARALSFRRALRRAPGAEKLAGFADGCDALLLSLILDTETTTTLRVVDPVLAAALAAPLGSDRPTLVSEGYAADATLLPFEAIGSAVAEGGGTVVVHDVPVGIPLRGEGGLLLLPLTQVSPATWRSRLALLCTGPDRARGVTLLDALRDLLRTEELDPLFLLDAINERRGADVDDIPAGDIEALRARCRSLEQRVRELEMSGLARHQTLLAEAALRRRYGS